MSRPSKYDPVITPVLGRALAREGHTDEEIAIRLEPPVSVATMNRWKVEHPEFRESLNEGKAIIDARVEEGLLQRALGYTVTETRLEAKADDSGKPMRGGKVIKTTRQVSPDTTACIYWLKNRRPDKWRDRNGFAVEASQEGIRVWLDATRPAPEDVAALFEGCDDEGQDW